MSKTTANVRAEFKKRLAEKRIVVAPGVFDALSAKVAESVGFEALFLSGSAVSYSQLGRPDIGLVSMPELVDAVSRVSDCVDVPVLADVDSAFGGAPHAARLICQFEKAGAAAVQIEDQVVVKPDDALLSRPLVSVKEMTGKIKAMIDARQNPDMLISARSDATDANEAIDRCAAYAHAGADIVFAERMTGADDLKRLVAVAGDETPVIYNAIYPDGDVVDAVGLDALGIRIALFPGLALQSAAAGMIEHLRKLREDPSLRGGAKTPLPAPELLDLLEAKEFLDQFS